MARSHPWRSIRALQSRSGAMWVSESFTNGRSERSGSSHPSKLLGNMNTSILRFRSLPALPGFQPHSDFFGPSEGHDSAVVSAGVSAQWKSAMTIYVNYDGQLGRGNYDSNAVTGGVRIGF